MGLIQLSPLFTRDALASAGVVLLQETIAVAMVARKTSCLCRQGVTQ
jgi:hypothetical protein